MGRKCAVPHCYTGYRKCKEKATLYRVPDDDFFLNKWQEAIAREDRPITPKDCVCEKHFRDEDIIRRRTIKDTVEMYQRPRLKPDAVPSIFPDLPKFILKMVKKRRKMPIETQQNSSNFTPIETIQSYSADQLDIKQEPFDIDFESIQRTSDVIVDNEIEIKTDEQEDADYFQQQTMSTDEDGHNIFCCKECDYKTRYPHNLRTHQTKHLSGEAAFFYCQYCPDFKTKWEITYKNHLKKKHGVHKKEVYKCTQCSFQTQAKMYFIRHYKIHSKKNVKNKLKCKYPECKFETDCLSSLNNHSLLHKSERQIELPIEQKSFKCTQCLYETNSKTHIIKHIKSAHNTRDDTVVAVNKFKTVSEYNERQIQFKSACTTRHDNVVAVNKFQRGMEYNENQKHIKNAHNNGDHTVAAVDTVETASECNRKPDYINSNNNDNIVVAVDSVYKSSEMQHHIGNAENIINNGVAVETVSRCIEGEKNIESANNTFDNTILQIDMVEPISEIDEMQTQITNVPTGDDLVETVSDYNEIQDHIKSTENMSYSDVSDETIPGIIEGKKNIGSAHNTFDDIVLQNNMVETISESIEMQTQITSAHKTTVDTVETVSESHITQEHIKSFHSVSASTNSESSTKQKEVSTKGKYVYKCSKCPYRVHNNMLMEKHEEKHKQTAAKNQSGSEVLKCHNCNYVTFFLDTLLNHQQTECKNRLKDNLEQASREQPSKADSNDIYIKDQFNTEVAILGK